MIRVFAKERVVIYETRIDWGQAFYAVRIASVATCTGVETCACNVLWLEVRVPEELADKTDVDEDVVASDHNLPASLACE